jgi:DNA (cytosine-5)-methyltransferase 1
VSAYYNEWDGFAADWLEELIKDGLIAPGDVDRRSITEVEPSDLEGYDQCHFFAGIGGWSYALRLAAWADRPVWTGSPPCQPFSAAGKQEGHTDPRHLWPAWFRLIRECRPPVVFGEQVAAAIGWGWLDLVSADLEGCGYAVGAAVLPAASVGAPHKRERLWFVADREQPGLEGYAGDEPSRDKPRREPANEARPTAKGSPTDAVADAEGGNGKVPIYERGQEQAGAESRRRGGVIPWADLVWLPCRDGKARPTESTLQRVANGLPAELGYLRHPDSEEIAYLSPLVGDTANRVGRLRGYGNAITAQVAAAFIEAYLGATDG